MDNKHQCCVCHKSSAEYKLYRSYGSFLRDDEIFCKEHVPVSYRSFYVPLIEDEDGSVWGYTSVPQEAIERWNKLLPVGKWDSQNWNSNFE